MADTDFLHGIETLEQTSGPRPVATADAAVIGLVFTAPDADADAFPIDTPVLVTSNAPLAAAIGSTGTGRMALEGILDQAGERGIGKIVAVRVTEGASLVATLSAVIGDPVTRTGMHALRRARTDLGLTPRILAAPGFTAFRPTDGVKTIAVGAQGTGYTSVPTVSIAAPPAGGRQAKAVASVSAGKVTAITVTDPGAGYTAAPAVTLAGGGGTGATATATLGTVANPVAAEFAALAKRLRAVAILDAPGTLAAAAYDYRQDFDSDRLFIVDPLVKVLSAGAVVTEPASARVAGLISAVSIGEGFWVSPSNHVVEGVIGLGRPIEHALDDPSVESQYLNSVDVAVVVRAPSGGFKLWGNRVPSSDPLKRFLSVRRAHDVIIDSIEAANEWAVDKPFSKQLLLDLAETVNGALRTWRARGATLGGRVWYDTDLNTAETMAAGQIYVHYDAEGPAPLERVTFVFNRNTGYYDELIGDVAREVARLSAAGA